MTTPNIIFLDTETTSLEPDRQVWEVGLIFRRHRQVGTPEFEDAEYQYIIEDVKLDNANVRSLEIGGFFERHARVGHARGYNAYTAAEEFFRMFHGAHVVGNVPSFDTIALENMLRAEGFIPTHHYHLLDIENLIVGYIRGIQNVSFNLTDETSEFLEDYYGEPLLNYDCQPPWNSEELSRLIGINPDNYRRHEALEDARWVRDSYDRIMGIK